ncbi:hypothetical protein [Aureimonas sp. AU20]|uniref:hypothetical protein n=1 Tax=Aureimonas sp. AU20 TaxID=1349819 RepID=UPI000AEA49FD|nr:hypothetical protein [Aureimonas sp. AU20]
MGDLVIFKLGRSAGIVQTFAEALASHDDEAAIALEWRERVLDLVRPLFGKVLAVDLDRELFDLMGSAAAAADVLRAARQREASKRQKRRPALRVVARRPEQLDLFDTKPGPAKAPAPIGGEISHVG